MLLSLLNRESMTRFSVSWQKGHFMASTEDREWRIGVNTHRFFILEHPFPLCLSKTVRINWKFFAELAHVSGDRVERAFIGHVAQRARYILRDRRHFIFFHAARRHCRRADADAARDKGRTRIERYGVPVDRDARLVQSFLC